MEPISPEIVNRVKPVRLFLMDVDGTLTDGKIHYSDSWIEHKSFDVMDGFGIQLLHRFGMKTGIITGRDSPIVTQRAKELEIEILRQGRYPKGEVLDEILKSENLTEDQVAFIGDDLFDLPALMRVGFSAAPSNAHPEVKKCVHFVSQYAGGNGAVREVCEIILKVQGHWESVLRKYTAGEANNGE